MAKKYNDILFLYNYFTALKNSVHTDPHVVEFNGKNYTFRESHNDAAWHTVTYSFNEDIKGVQIPEDDFKQILRHIQLQEHENISECKL
jgi:hypothetical protein